MSIDELCVHYNAARLHDSEENKYKEMGCYQCKGLNKECEHYVPLSELLFKMED